MEDPNFRGKTLNWARRPSENLLVQREVIFPRVQVARNERRVDRHAPHIGPMPFKEASQAGVRIEVLQFGPINQVDQHRVTTSSVMLRLNQRVSSAPLGNYLLNDPARGRRMIDRHD